jgi:hypothetical protein
MLDEFLSCSIVRSAFGFVLLWWILECTSFIVHLVVAGSAPRDSAELSHNLESFGSSSKDAEIGPDSFGIVVCRFVGTVPDIRGLV